MAAENTSVIPLSKLIALDLETSGDAPLFGLQPWRAAQGRAQIKSYALAWWDDEGVLQQAGGIWPTRQKLTEVLDRIAKSGRYCLGWNVPFDIAWLCADGHYPAVSSINWLDGMLLWRHLMVEPEYDTNRNKKRSYNLESAIEFFYPNEGGFKDFDDFDAVDPESMRKLLIRNLGDAKYTLLIGGHLIHQLPARRLRPALIEAHCMPWVGRANCWGLDVNASTTRHLSQKLANDAATLLAQLEPHGVTEAVVRSPKQLGEVLFTQWGLPVQGMTDSGQPSTDKEALYNLAVIDPRAKLVKEYREALNNRGKFADALLTAIEYNGEPKIHPTARVFGTYTGRMTYSSKVGKANTVAERTISSALHQTKRGRDYREPVEAPEGYAVVEFDARTQEYRWMAILSGDQTMLALCQEGEDAHAYMGAQIMGVDYHRMLDVIHEANHPEYAVFKNGRQMGKTANLSCQYRTGAKKVRMIAQIQYDVPMTEAMSVQVHGMYPRTYPRVPIYWQNSIRIAKHQGYVESLAGRQVQLPNDGWDDKDVKWMLESTALNYPIQATGADQKYLAIACLKRVVSQHHAFFLFEMHDGIYFIVPNANVDAFCRDGQQVLNNLPYEKTWGVTLPIDMPWDVKTGQNWGELKEWKP